MAAQRSDAIMRVETKEFQALLAVMYALFDYDHKPTAENGAKVLEAYRAALRFQEGK